MNDVTVKVTFPEDYFVAELAGKEAEFKTHIHDIKRKELPELNDEFAKEASSYETIEELKNDLRAKMEEEASRRAIDTYNADLIQAAVKNATVDIPEVMINDRVEQMIQELAMNMEGRGLKLDDYLVNIHPTNYTKIYVLNTKIPQLKTYALISIRCYRNC